MSTRFKPRLTPLASRMYPFDNLYQLGAGLSFVCDQCQQRYEGTAPPRAQRTEFLDIVKGITALRESGAIEDNAFRELLIYVTSIYVVHRVGDRLMWSLDKALCEKLSPDKLFKALS